MRLRSYIAFILSVLTLAATAQVVQQGVVLEYQGSNTKKPLDQVEVNVRYAATVMTGKDGKFTLHFHTQQPGKKVQVLRIDKPGYEIFQPEMVDQWNINPEEPFRIVLVKSSEQRKREASIYNKNVEQCRKEQKQEEEELLKSLTTGRLEDEQYEAELKKIRQYYEERIVNIKDYAERFARIDLSTLSEVEQRIMALVEQGQLDEAIELYEQQNLKLQYSQLTLAHQTASALDQQLLADRRQMREKIHRQADLYRMKGGTENYEKLYQLLKDIANADTTNVEAVAEFAVACQEELGRVSEVERYIDLALRQPQQDKLLQALLYRQKAQLQYYRIDQKEYLRLAYDILEPMLAQDSLHVLPQLAQVQSDLGWCSAYWSYPSNHIYPNKKEWEEAVYWTQESLRNREHMFALNPQGVWRLKHIVQEVYQSELGWSEYELGKLYKLMWRNEEANHYYLRALENLKQTVERERKPQYYRSYAQMLEAAQELFDAQEQSEQVAQFQQARLEALKILAQDNTDLYMATYLKACAQAELWNTVEQNVEEWADAHKSSANRINFALPSIYRMAAEICNGEYGGSSYDANLELAEKYYHRCLAMLEARPDSLLIGENMQNNYKYFPIVRAYKALTGIAYQQNKPEQALLYLDEAKGILSSRAPKNSASWNFRFAVNSYEQEVAENSDYFPCTYGNIYLDLLNDTAKAVPHYKELLHVLENSGNRKWVSSYNMDLLTDILIDDAARRGCLDEAMTYLAKHELWGTDSLKAPQRLHQAAQAMTGEWEYPMTAMQRSGFTPKATVAPKNNTHFYLFNVETRQFLTCGNSWGTEASVDTVGMKFMLRQEASQIDKKQKGWTLEALPDSLPPSERLYSQIAKRTTPLLMFHEGDGHAYLDMSDQNTNNPDCHLWTIKPTEDQGYNIQMVPSCKQVQYRGESIPAYNENEYFGWTPHNTNYLTQQETYTAVSPRAMKEDGITWFFLTEKQYRAQRKAYQQAVERAGYGVSPALYLRINDILQKANATPEQRRALGRRGVLGKVIRDVTKRMVVGRRDSLVESEMLYWLAQEMAGEWKAPEWQRVKFMPKETAQPTADTDLYLYNVEAGQFLTNGNAWDTQASVDAQGLRFTLEQKASQVSPSQTGWTLSSGLLIPITASGRCALRRAPMFYDKLGHAFLDKRSQDKEIPDCHLWTIKEAKGGGYTIQIVPTCSLFKEEYFGWVENGHNARTGAETRTEASPCAKDTDGITWLFLTEEQYQAERANYLAAVRAATENNARFDLYNRVNSILRQCTITPEQRRAIGQRLLQQMEAEK